MYTGTWLATVGNILSTLTDILWEVLQLIESPQLRHLEIYLKHLKYLSFNLCIPKSA